MKASRAGDDLATLRARGPLPVSSDNPLYFADSENRIVYLTGSHSWENFQDITDAFDYQAYLTRLAALNHNFIRLWVSESIQSDGGGLMHPPARKIPVIPLPYLRTGPGVALDGRPRLDLSQLNPVCFERLRASHESRPARAIPACNAHLRLQRNVTSGVEGASVLSGRNGLRPG